MRAISCALLTCSLLVTSIGAQATQPDLQPAPSIQAQTAARQELMHSLDEGIAQKPAAERAQAARRLLTHARDFESTRSFRYVELTEAANLAAGAGDIATASEALDILATKYATDILALKRDALVAALSASTKEEAALIPPHALSTARAALETNRFDLAAQLASIAENAAHKSQNLPLAASIQVPIADIRSIVAQSTQARAAQARLAGHPDDADAHLVVGKFLVLYQGRMAEGLPHLLAGGDPTLRALAELETAHPTNDPAQRALADAWWSFAQTASGVEKSTAQARGVYWYKQALAAFDAQGRPAIEARIAAVEPPTTQPITLAQTQPAPPPAIDNPKSKIENPLAPAPAGLDLLALIDLPRDASNGSTWNRTPDGLACDKSPYATCAIPLDLPDEFDLVLTFSRTEGNGAIAALLRARSRAFGFCLDIRNKARFERVGNKIDEGNPTVVPVDIVNNRRYTLTLQVRKDLVRALLDGQPLTEYKTDLKDLSRYDKWKMADATLPGLGANGAKVLFHAVRLVEITGKARPTRTRNP